MTAYPALTDRERGILEGLRLALAALDGHGLHDTAHDRVRRLLACSECHHMPEKHEGGEVCQESVFTGHGALLPCACAEYEVAWLTLASRDSGAAS